MEKLTFHTQLDLVLLRDNQSPGLKSSVYYVTTCLQRALASSFSIHYNLSFSVFRCICFSQRGGKEMRLNRTPQPAVMLIETTRLDYSVTHEHSS